MAEMKELTRIEEVDQILGESSNKPIFIFKHNHICPISVGAFRHYEAFVRGYEKEDILFTLIRIREHRDISNAIAERLGVKHESPQAILVVDGRAVWNDSHYEITENKLKQVVMMYENNSLKA
ncbi:hypothetical protein BBF96_11780 [Anoxybacter fermentans]|uniref:General stress protein n=1 Tax=Anoxybacter fermentans TaxID=1323375 RepID=A0A3S9T0R6_9FIRM|nr:bacillithiol system redox-active protein YtxJ [Anoxybacter fermentans]AZR74012.1 hypothetical protein BBF96_11780 [Anoxybacter fermentans]